MIPEKTKNLKPYKSEVFGSINLSANESFIEFPDELKRKMTAAFESVAFNRYPEGRSDVLLEAFAALHNLPQDCLTAGNGSDELIAVIVNSLTEEGDTVVTMTPDFSMYTIYCGGAGCREIKMTKRDDDTFDPDELVEFVKQQDAKMLLFSNPCNPTGKAIKAEQVMHIVTSLPDTVVVVDEAYVEFAGDGYSILPQSLQHEHCIVLRTLSKSVGLAALRVGFAISAQPLTDALQAARSPYNVNSVTQAVATVVLKEHAMLKDLTERIKNSKVALFNALQPLSETYGFVLSETVTNFIIIKTDKAAQILDFMNNNDITVRMPVKGMLRVTAGSDKENAAFCALLEQFWQR